MIIITTGNKALFDLTHVAMQEARLALAARVEARLTELRAHKKSVELSSYVPCFLIEELLVSVDALKEFNAAVAS